MWLNELDVVLVLGKIENVFVEDFDDYRPCKSTSSMSLCPVMILSATLVRLASWSTLCMDKSLLSLSPCRTLTVKGMVKSALAFTSSHLFISSEWKVLNFGICCLTDCHPASTSLFRFLDLTTEYVRIFALQGLQETNPSGEPPLPSIYSTNISYVRLSSLKRCAVAG